LLYRADNLLRRGVDSIKGLATFNKLVVDEESSLQLGYINGRDHLAKKMKRGILFSKIWMWRVKAKNVARIREIPLEGSVLYNIYACECAADTYLGDTGALHFVVE
jgi:hypothetical protein